MGNHQRGLPVRRREAVALDLYFETRVREQPLRRLEGEGQVAHHEWRPHEQVAQVRNRVVAAAEEPGRENGRGIGKVTNAKSPPGRSARKMPATNRRCSRRGISQGSCASSGKPGAGAPTDGRGVS